MPSSEHRGTTQCFLLRLQPAPLKATLGLNKNMTHMLLKFAHVLGAILIGGGLISVWLSDLRSRQLRELPQFSEAVRNIAVFYDGVVVPV